MLILEHGYTLLGSLGLIWGTLGPQSPLYRCGNLGELLVQFATSPLSQVSGLYSHVRVLTRGCIHTRLSCLLLHYHAVLSIPFMRCCLFPSCDSYCLGAHGDIRVCASISVASVARIPPGVHRLGVYRDVNSLFLHTPYSCTDSLCYYSTFHALSC